MTDITVITGASSGIGAAVAERFAQRGDTVVLMARRVDALNEVASRIVEAGGRAVVMPVDVTEGDVSAAFREFTQHSHDCSDQRGDRGSHVADFRSTQRIIDVIP